MSQPSEEHQGPVVRDKRRIDPETGEVRVPPTETPAAAPASDQGTTDQGTTGTGATGAGTSGTGASGTSGASGAGKEDDGEMAKLKAKLDERTHDLQRLQAEYANYRKRVERDRVAVREQALANVLVELLPVLDDIGRARDHDELTGGFKSVGEALEAKVAKLGLERYGEKGEPFDPTVHEALMHSYSPEVTEPTCVEILQPGYRVGDRVLRPARVAVAEPEEPPTAAAAAATTASAIEDLQEPDASAPEYAAESDPAESAGGSGGSGGPHEDDEERD